MKLKILSYNIHGGRGRDGLRDYHRIGEFIKSQNIQIALIQELDTRPYKRDTEKAINELRASHFPYFVAAPTVMTNDGWYGNAILSQFPVARNNVIDISHPGREPRNILEAFIETPAGPLHLMNTHKGLKSSERGLQLAKLNDLLLKQSDVPLIVGGDLNEWQTSSAALKKLDLILNPMSAGATFPTVFPLFKLDRMWCRPAKVFKSIEVLKTSETKKYSDHYPILAEIEI